MTVSTDGTNGLLNQAVSSVDSSTGIVSTEGSIGFQHRSR
jgi:hypothetical protein